MKKRAIIGILLAAFLGALWIFLMHRPEHDYGIAVQFEQDTPAEYEYALAEQYVEQYHAVLLDDPLPQDYTLLFPNMPERQVKEKVGSLMDTDYVLRALFVQVDIAD